MRNNKMPNESSKASAAGKRLLNISDVVDKVRLSRATIYRMVKAETFPAMVKYGRSSRWVESSIDEWIMQHAEAAA